MVARIANQPLDVRRLLRLVEASEVAPASNAAELSAVGGNQTLPDGAAATRANEAVPIASNGGVSSDVLRARLEAAAASQARPQAATAANHPTLRRGSSGAYVKELQQALKAKGFNPGPIDGDFGPRTEAAVKAYQRANHLAVDGIVGPKTWGKLHGAGSTTGSGGTSQTHGSGPTLRQGVRGEAVKKLQDRLKDLGFNPGPIDGDFGPRTKAAVQAFQRARGLEADGIVGPKTWDKLGIVVHGGVSSGSGSSSAASGTAEKFVQRALAQEGDRYIYGAETNLDDPNPNTFDCSELVQWAAHQAGGYMPDGSANQEAYCRQRGTIISVDRALHTRGALLFKDGHVAISLGDGVHTIEAMGRNYGVVRADGRGRFRCGGLIPGMHY